MESSLNFDKKGNLFKIKPNEFLNKMTLRGWKYTEELKNEISIEELNFYKKTNICSDNNNILYKVLDVFSDLREYNIDPKIYTLIFLSLSTKNIKNLYRYILIKWSKIKYKYIGNNIQEFDFSFENIFENSKNLEKIEIQKLFLDIIKKFIEKNRFYIIFFINVMQEYLCPIT